MFKPFKKRIQNGVYGPTSKKWKFHVCLSSLLLGWDLIPPIMKFLFYVIVYATGCNFRVLVFYVLQFSLELVCTTHVVAGENKSFWNMVLWNVLGLTNKHRTHPRSGQKKNFFQKNENSMFVCHHCCWVETWWNSYFMSLFTRPDVISAF